MVVIDGSEAPVAERPVTLPDELADDDDVIEVDDDEVPPAAVEDEE